MKKDEFNLNTILTPDPVGVEVEDAFNLDAILSAPQQPLDQFSDAGGGDSFDLDSIIGAGEFQQPEDTFDLDAIIGEGEFVEQEPDAVRRLRDSSGFSIADPDAPSPILPDITDDGAVAIEPPEAEPEDQGLFGGFSQVMENQTGQVRQVRDRVLGLRQEAKDVRAAGDEATAAKLEAEALKFSNMVSALEEGRQESERLDTRFDQFRKAYLPVKAMFGGATFGIGDNIFDAVEHRIDTRGGNIRAESLDEEFTQTQRPAGSLEISPISYP